MKSHIEVNQETGVRCLTVFYDRHLDNFNQAIEKGLSDHGLKHGEATVIALPKTMKCTAPYEELR
ncbi:MAG: hypothetical protein GWP06_17880 [Actinobacteria bacterium]|nr:hypothetical protein [Actinomycetota bacterium]